MNVSEKGIFLIKSAEAFSSIPYQDSVGVWTIGYGTTVYSDGTKVTKDDKPITEIQATNLLKEYLELTEIRINTAVKVPLTQNQFDALCSFIYNVGARNFLESTLLKLLNQGEYQLAAEQFPRWNKAGGKVLRGLTNRREKEKQLFLEE